jgi:hypothetical protein
MLLRLLGDNKPSAVHCKGGDHIRSHALGAANATPVHS